MGKDALDAVETWLEGWEEERMAEPLTRERVMALEAGPELDALVTEKVMGGMVVFSDPTCWRGISARYADGSVGDVPQYSADIARAWDVVEKIRQTARSKVVVNDYRPIHFHDNGLTFENRSGTFEVQGWRVEEEAEDGSDRYAVFFEIPGGLNAVGARAGTAPLAICRAALLTVIE